jgi:hypothetical protein
MNPPDTPPPAARWFKWFVAAVILANVGLIVYVMIPRGEKLENADPASAPNESSTNPIPAGPDAPNSNWPQLPPAEPPPEPLIAPGDLSAGLFQDSLGMGAN